MNFLGFKDIFFPQKFVIAGIYDVKNQFFTIICFRR